MKRFEKYVNAFFALFPRGIWFLLLFGLFLHVLGDDPRTTLGTVVVNVALTLLFLKLGVIWHESGHLVAAKLAGGTPRRMVLGSGHEILRFRVRGIQFILNSYFNMGLAYSSTNQFDGMKWRLAFYTAGGLVANLFVVAIIYILCGFNSRFFWGNGIDVPNSLLIANSLLVLASAIPRYSHAQGFKSGSDGLRLIQLPFQRKEELEIYNLSDLLYEAMELFENRQYDAAYAIYKRCLEQNPTMPILWMNLASIDMKKGEIDTCIEKWKKVESQLSQEELKLYNDTLQNFLAWAYLVKGDIELADHHSAQINMAKNRQSCIRGTRGSVLIERGN